MPTRYMPAVPPCCLQAREHQNPWPRLVKTECSSASPEQGSVTQLPPPHSTRSRYAHTRSLLLLASRPAPVLLAAHLLEAVGQLGRRRRRCWCCWCCGRLGCGRLGRCGRRRLGRRVVAVGAGRCGARSTAALQGRQQWRAVGGRPAAHLPCIRAGCLAACVSSPCTHTATCTATGRPLTRARCRPPAAA